MEEIKNIITSINQEQINSILIAVGIAIGLKIFSSILARIIIKIFKLNKKQKVIENAFYKPLKTFFTLSGIYIAILILKSPLKISAGIMSVVNTIYRVLIIIISANGFAQSLNPKSKLIKKLQNKIDPDKAENNSSIGFLAKLLKIAIYIIAGFLIIQELGFDLGGLVAGLGLGGVILTLAAQDTAKNLLGGVVIFIDKPCKVGDFIEVGNYVGVVEDITFRSTAIRTADDSLLHIPNSEMSSVAITNWNEINRRRYRTSLLINLGTPLEKIQKTKNEIEKMLSEQEGILVDTIIVNFDNILNSGNELVVIAYTDITDYRAYLKLKETLNYNIMQIVENNNVNLAHNAQTVYVKN